MKDFVLLLGTLAVWIALTRWVLPWFGIQTCCSSGGCATSCCPTCATEPSAREDANEAKNIVDSKGNQP
jgi:hypothetical protein